MENSNNRLSNLVRLIDASFERLRLLTGVDFLDVKNPVFAGFDGAYFIDWLRDVGDERLAVIRQSISSYPTDNQTLDVIDYNAFALGKSVATENPEIIYATMADVLVDVAKAIEKVAKENVEVAL